MPSLSGASGLMKKLTILVDMIHWSWGPISKVATSTSLMLKISKQELNYLLKAIVEHKAKLQRIKPYPLQKSDIRPYDGLIRKLTEYRSSRLGRRIRQTKKQFPSG